MLHWSTLVTIVAFCQAVSTHSSENGQNSSRDIPGCSRQELGSDANSSSRIQPNEFIVNFTDKLIIVQLLNISNSANYSGSVIQACEGAKDVNPLMFEEEISQCKTEANFNESRITLSNCTHNDVARNPTKIVMINCSTCIQLYIIEYINCTQYCESNLPDDNDDESCSDTTNDESGSDREWGYRKFNFSEVQAVPDMECRRLKYSYIHCSNTEEYCTCCSVYCQDYPYLYNPPSENCPKLIVNCNSSEHTSLPGSPSRFSNAFCKMNCEYKRLNCSGANHPFCMSICEDLSDEDLENQVRRFDDFEVGEVEGFCTDQIRQNCSNVRLPGLQDCTNSTGFLPKCARICRRNRVERFFADGCPSEAYIFCEEFLEGLLNSSRLTKENFQIYVTTINRFIMDISPYNLVEDLEVLFDIKFVDEDDMLTLFANSCNVQGILNVYDDLFDDEVTSNWTQGYRARSRKGSEVSALLQLETLGNLVGNSILKRNKSSAFSFQRSNLFFSVNIPSRNRSFGDKHRVSIQGKVLGKSSNKSLKEFIAEVQVPINVLCKTDEVENCSSTVAVSVTNNLVNYLHRAYRNDSNNNLDIEYAEYEPVTELLSVQVFGVPNLNERLTESPVEVTITLPVTNLTKGNLSNDSVRCVFWNHSQISWSTEGVTTDYLENNTVRCNSTHLTSFAVLVSFSNQSAGYSPDKIALSVISYIGCVISISCLLATIICLILFRKILNKGPLLYVHLNLAIALLLGYLFFVVGVDTVKGEDLRPLCIVLAALMQYFFLASFCWMLCEGIMLYLLVVRVFGNAAQRWYWLLIVGWGLPIPIVVISAAVLQEKYISPNYCWLDSDPTKAAIWTFVTPVLVVILINTVILVMTVISIVRGRKHGGAETVVKARTLVITAIRGTIVLLPLLGITWVIGLFAVNENTTVFAWLFVLINSFQGLFIFFLHVLRNKAFLRKIKQTCFTREEKKTVLTSSTMMSTKQGIETSTLDYNSRSIAPSISESPSDKKENRSLTVVIETGSDVL